MKLKAKIRQIGTLAVPNTPIWQIWSPTKRQVADRARLIEQLELLLTAGQGAGKFVRSHDKDDRSVELVSIQRTKYLALEYVFRLEFDRKKGVTFDIDLYGEVTVAASNSPSFANKVQLATNEFDNLVHRLTNRLANRFKVEFEVVKISRLVPYSPSGNSSGRAMAIPGKPHVQYWPAPDIRDVRQVDDDPMWVDWLKDHPSAPVFNIATGRPEVNPFVSGEGGEFGGGGTTGNWTLEKSIYTAIPRDESPDQVSKPIMVEDIRSEPPTPDTGWSAPSFTATESTSSDGGSSSGSDGGGGGD